MTEVESTEIDVFRVTVIELIGMLQELEPAQELDVLKELTDRLFSVLQTPKALGADPLVSACSCSALYRELAPGTHARYCSLAGLPLDQH